MLFQKPIYETRSNTKGATKTDPERELAPAKVSKDVALIEGPGLADAAYLRIQSLPKIPNASSGCDTYL
jgi:hypothetical protein